MLTKRYHQNLCYREHLENNLNTAVHSEMFNFDWMFSSELKRLSFNRPQFNLSDLHCGFIISHICTALTVKRFCNFCEFSRTIALRTNKLMSRFHLNFYEFNVSNCCKISRNCFTSMVIANSNEILIKLWIAIF